jgi:hypothetical protein
MKSNTVKTTPAPAAKKVAQPTAVAKKAPPRKAPVAKHAAPAPQPAAQKVAVPAEPAKPKKPKLVRDSFTIPKGEYTVLESLKQRSVDLGQTARKSELLRAGIKALAAMPDQAFKAALAAVPAIKTGRPGKAK